MYVAHVRIIAGGVYGANNDLDAAVDRCIKEMHDFVKRLGGFTKDAIIKIPVFYIPEGHYWRGDDTGDYVVNRETDQDVGFATLAALVEYRPNSPTKRWMLPVEERNRIIEEANRRKFGDG